MVERSKPDFPPKDLLVASDGLLAARIEPSITHEGVRIINLDRTIRSLRSFLGFPSPGAWEVWGDDEDYLTNSSTWRMISHVNSTAARATMVSGARNRSKTSVS